jgi:signal transduction histidine kinase
VSDLARRPRFVPRWQRLRTQLLAAFALIAVVALVAGGAAVVWLMIGYRTQVTFERYRDAAGSAAGAATMLERQGATPEVIAAGVAAQVPLPAVRVLVLNSAALVLADEVASSAAGATGVAGEDAPGSLVGERIEIPAPNATAPTGPPRPSGSGEGSPPDRVLVWRGEAGTPRGSRYLFVAATGPAPERSLGRPPDRGAPPLERLVPAPGSAVAYRIVLAIPLASIPSAWQELAPGLAVAAALALLAAAGVAWWLAGSIVRPIRAVTQATALVARGEPHEPVPETGVEEVVDLARGFNQMAQEVERSHQALRDFVADASHELRTPLTAIQGFSQAVADGVLDAPEPTREAATYIQREAERMRRLVEDLLLLSRIEASDRGAGSSGAGERSGRDAVDVADLLDTLTQRLQPAARERALRIVLDLPAGPPAPAVREALPDAVPSRPGARVAGGKAARRTGPATPEPRERLLAPGDALHLERLFGNLLDNAVKYTPEGGTITVRALRVPEGSRDGAHELRRAGAHPEHGKAGPARQAGQEPRWQLSVTVHNTGSYIPPQDLPHIFERFYRVEKSRSREVAGSGLGLAIAWEVAQRHGGTIQATSDPAAGTTFAVTLPAAPEPEQAGRASAKASDEARRRASRPRTAPTM